MAFKNIVSLFRKTDKQRERFADILGKDSSQDKEKSNPIPILDDRFTESSTGIIAQIKKYPFLRFAEFTETQRTSFSKNTIFVVEILDDVVNVAIVSRKGVFLDIEFLKGYSYEDLKDIYFQIVPDSDETVEEIRSSVENIISIVAYDIVYALPKKIVIIDNLNSDLKEIAINSSRFSNKENTNDLMLRELAIDIGYSSDEIIYSTIEKPYKKNDTNIRFIISWCELQYFELINNYVEKADFELKKLHSIPSSLYASFSNKDRDAVMRVHVQGNLAYTLYKIKNKHFEYKQYNLKDEYEDIEIDANMMEEIILSGDGDYYEMLKNSFLQDEIPVRWWNYEYDLGCSIIRKEESIELDNRYANILSTAYYELFNMRFAMIRLGVGIKLSLYEFVAVNLNILPVLMIIFSLLGMSGWYHYENLELAKLKKTNKEYSRFFKQEKSVNKEIQRHQTNIKKVKGKIERIDKIMKDRVEVKAAIILYELATKLPDDIILTLIQKDKDVIVVKGKCFLESSLLKLMRILKIKNKTVYLVEMKDTGIIKSQTDEEQNLQYMVEEAENSQNGETVSSISLPSSMGTEIQYSDTLNNSFTLEIR